MKAPLVVGDAFVPALPVKEHRDDLFVDQRELIAVLGVVGQVAKVRQRLVDPVALEQRQAVQDRLLATESRPGHQRRAQPRHPHRERQPSAVERGAGRELEQPGHHHDEGGERDGDDSEKSIELDRGPDRQQEDPADDEHVATLTGLEPSQQPHERHAGDHGGRQDELLHDGGLRRPRARGTSPLPRGRTRRPARLSPRRRWARGARCGGTCRSARRRARRR